jgi:hypothetical protein
MRRHRGRRGHWLRRGQLWCGGGFSASPDALVVRPFGVDALHVVADGGNALSVEPGVGGGTDDATDILEAVH